VQINTVGLNQCDAIHSYARIDGVKISLADEVKTNLQLDLDLKRNVKSKKYFDITHKDFRLKRCYKHRIR
jgi:hypothetical protein